MRKDEKYTYAVKTWPSIAKWMAERRYEGCRVFELYSSAKVSDANVLYFLSAFANNFDETGPGKDIIKPVAFDNGYYRYAGYSDLAMVFAKKQPPDSAWRKFAFAFFLPQGGFPDATSQVFKFLHDREKNRIKELNSSRTFGAIWDGVRADLSLEGYRVLDGLKLG